MTCRKVPPTPKITGKCYESQRNTTNTNGMVPLQPFHEPLSTIENAIKGLKKLIEIMRSERAITHLAKF
jgi:hypothetical protein